MPATWCGSKMPGLEIAAAVRDSAEVLIARLNIGYRSVASCHKEDGEGEEDATIHTLFLGRSARAK